MSKNKTDWAEYAVSAAAAMAAGYIVKEAVSAAWRKVAKSDPPQKPESKDVSLSEAIAWTVVSSVAVGVAGLVASRGALSILDKARDS